MAVDPVGVVLEWERAVNAADIERLFQWSHEEMVIVGPRGRARGRGVLRQWLDRARLESETLRVFHCGDVVVIAQRATWHAETGEPIGTTAIASRFLVSDGVVTEYERYDRLEDALEAAGLSGEDEV